MLWLIFTVMTLAAVAALLFPLLKPAGNAAPPRADYDIIVYRSQLQEIEREIEDGLLTNAQADAARVEVHRRMLAAEDAELDKLAKPAGTAGRYARLIAIIAIAAGVPLGAAVAYGALGSPNLAGKPYAWRLKNDPDLVAETSVEKLSAAMQTDPSASGYKRLADLYFSERKYEEAADADRHAIDLGADDASMWSELGETIVMASGGAVAPDALLAFSASLEKDSQDARARFYIGLAEAQIGNLKQAVAVWRDLEKSAPSDARWLPMVREHIAAFSREGGFDPASVAPSPPSVEAMHNAVAAMTNAVKAHTGKSGTAAPSKSSDQDTMIRNMVAQLAARMEKNPDDVAGWQRLAHAYNVLGERTKARYAIDRAVRLKPADIGVLLTLAEIQMASAAPGDDASADFISTMRKVMAVDPANIDALYYVGLAEQKAGHLDRARALWNKVLAVAPATDPLAIAIHNRLDIIAGKKRGH